MSNRSFGLVVLVALLWSVYVLTSAGKFHIVDEVSLFALTESLATRGQVDTNAIAWTQWVNSPGEVLGAFGPSGDVYSKKGPAPAVVAVPWYWLLRTVAGFDVGMGLVQGTLLWNGLLTALTAALLWLTALRLGYDDRTGMVMGLLFGLGTIAWPYANHFFGEPLSALGLFTTFYGILAYRDSGRVGWMWLAGLGAALAVGTVVAHTTLVLVLGMYWLMGVLTGAPANKGKVGRAFLRHSSAGVGFVLPILVVGLLLLAYNFMRFGNPFDTGYHFESGEGFTAAAIDGAWGLLLSPYRGVLWHTPLFLAALLCFPAFLRRHFTEATIVLALSFLLIGLYSRWWMWWGGFAWGPRFLVPLTPFWVLTLAPTVAHITKTLTDEAALRTPWTGRLLRLGGAGWLVAALALLSVVVQWLAVSVNYVNYEIKLRSLFPTDWEDPLRYGPPAQRLVDWQSSPILGQVQLLWENFRGNTDLAWLRADGVTNRLTLFVGLAALITLGLLLANLYRTLCPGQKHGNASLLMVGMTPLIAMTLTGVWLGQTATDPHYGAPNQGYRAVLTEICRQAQPGDAVITVAPFAYQIPMNWLPGECATLPPIYGYATDSMQHAETMSALLQALQSHERLWLITGGLPANDPENSIERWLAEVAYEAEDRWFDDYRLVRYATPLRLLDGVTNQLDMPLSSTTTPQVTVIAGHAPARIPAGAILPVEIAYQLDTPMATDLHWFVQLLSMDGYAVALIDTQPAHGYRPFSTLPTGEVLVERVALQTEATLAPGVYQLIAGLYDPTVAGGQRLQLPNGRDNVELGVIEVTP